MAPRDERPPRQSFHRDLRLARLLPRLSVTGSTLGVVRAFAPAKKVRSTADVDVSTVMIAGAEGALPARVFRPRRAAAPAPLVFWIHGGGMMFGKPWQDDAKNLRIATELGAVVVAPSYRLAPEHPQPAAFDDVYAAYRDVVARAEELGADPERVAIAGASAGGALAAGLAQRLHDGGGRQPLLQLLVYPLLDDRTVLRDDLDERSMRAWLPASNRFMWRSYLAREPGVGTMPEYIVPARRDDLTGLPPAWIGIGTLDLFFDESLEYAERLRAAGVPCEVVTVPGAFHAFESWAPRADVSRRFVGDWIAALRRAFVA